MVLCIAYIAFIYVARTQQNNLILKQNLLQQQLLETRLEIQEATFNAISTEIHDNVGQVLSLAKVQINIIQESDTLNKDILDHVKENITTALSDLRDIAGSLNSERIRYSSIHVTLQKEIDRINKTGIIRASMVSGGLEKEMNEQKKLVLLRIVQECLQNCIKHAQASAVSVSLQHEKDCLCVTVRDDGKGFDINDDGFRGKGMGLLNIRTRSALTGGSSTIESVIGRGTTIQITIPYA